jgi:hypothetical protein
MPMTPEDIKPILASKLKAQAIGPRVFLDKLRLIDESSRKSSQYQDPNYLPFYYHIGKLVQPKSLLHIGLDLGLPSCCFLQGSPQVERMLCFQRASKDFYSPRIALSNIKDVKGKMFPIDYYYGNVVDGDFIKKMSLKFDMVIITEKINGDRINETLDVCWEYLNLDGFLCLDYASETKDIFSDFCKARNRPFVFFTTRYGAGLTQK